MPFFCPPNHSGMLPGSKKFYIFPIFQLVFEYLLIVLSTYFIEHTKENCQSCNNYTGNDNNDNIDKLR